MHDVAAPSADHELRLLGAMVDCAYELGMAFGAAAKAEQDHDRRLQLFDAFNRGALAVRMGIRLSLTLRAAPKAAAPAALARDRLESEKLETERVETERTETERLEADRERERDYEPVSLPKFLATLGVVAADAARLDNLPAEIREGALPTLNDLLARAKAGAAPPPAFAQRPSTGAPATGVTLLRRPPPPAPKSRLLGSASTVLPKAIPPAGRLRRRGSG